MCFAVGVMISDILKLHMIKRRNLYAMAPPVGFFMTGFMLNSAKVITVGQLPNGIPEIDKQFDFMQDLSQYMMFSGVMMFIGASVPTIFEELRRKLGSADPPPPATGRSHPAE